MLNEWSINFFFYRQKFVLRSAKKGGAPNEFKQYTQKKTQAPEKKEET